MNSGKKGEEYVCRYLKKNGAKILSRNYSCRFGEIDIISEKDGFLIFTEVKTRDEDPLVLAQEAVDIKKQQKIIKAAQIYIKFTENNSQPRFDVACVSARKGKPYELTYYENAFFAKGSYL